MEGACGISGDHQENKQSSNTVDHIQGNSSNNALAQSSVLRGKNL